MRESWTHTLIWQGEKHDLEPGESVVGRSRTCDLSIADPSVSRRHVVLVPGPGHLLVKDLGSSNGSFADGVKIQGEAVLEDGGVLRLGDAEVHVRVRSDFDDHATIRLPAQGLPEPGEATSLLARESLELAEASSTAADAVSPVAGSRPAGPPAQPPVAEPPPAPIAGATPPPAPSGPAIAPPAAPAAQEDVHSTRRLPTMPAAPVSEAPSSGQEFQPVPPPDTPPPASPPPAVAPPSAPRSRAESSFAGLMDPSGEVPAPSPPAPPAPEPPAAEPKPLDLPGLDLPAPELPALEPPAPELSHAEPTPAEPLSPSPAEPGPSLDALPSLDSFATPAAVDSPSSFESPAEPQVMPDFPSSFAPEEPEEGEVIEEPGVGALPTSFDQPMTPATPPPAMDEAGALRPPSSAGELLPSLDDIDSALGGPEMEPPAVAAPGSGFYPKVVSAPPAGFWLRLVATVLDAVWIGGVAFAAQIATGDPTIASAAGLLGPVVVLVGWAIWGTTPGKRALGLYVHGPDGGAGIGFARALLRYLGYLASSVLLGFGFVMVAFDGEKRGLHDRIAGTTVRRHA